MSSNQRTSISVDPLIDPRGDHVVFERGADVSRVAITQLASTGDTGPACPRWISVSTIEGGNPIGAVPFAAGFEPSADKLDTLTKISLIVKFL